MSGPAVPVAGNRRPDGWRACSSVGVARILTIVVPALPVCTPWWFAILAEGMAITVGLAAGILPARQAARMESVDALRAE